MSLPLNTIIQGDTLQVLKTWPDNFIQTCVTSPPYWGLRCYGVDGQLGLEKTPEEYVAKMTEIFREVRRCLRDDGTVWLNLGDSYAGSWGDSGHRPDRTGIVGQQREKNSEWFKRNGHPQANKPVTVSPPGLKPKDLCGIPWRVAFALRKDGWYLRSDIIWAKPNPMPESVTDRPTKAHEYIFLLTKNANYFYDAEAIREPQSEATFERSKYQLGGFNKAEIADKTKVNYVNPNTEEATRLRVFEGIGRNKRTVWEVATQPYSEAHFATFPEKLIEPCILAGTSEKGCCEKCGAPWERILELTQNKVKSDYRRDGRGILGRKENQHGGLSGYKNTETKTLGWQLTCKCNAGLSKCIVLDPFMGSGTTALVACKFNRDFLGIELNEKYIKMANRRVAHEKAQIKMF